MGNGIFPDEATIYIAAANTNGSALVSSSDAVTGEVSNFSETGGEQDIDSIPVFGGGNIDKENPRTQIEVSFDIEMQYAPDNGDVTKWDSFKYGTGLTSATQGSKKAIALQWYNGTNYYTRFYNNCQGVSWSPGSGADGNLKGTITFKASPTTTSGAANLKISAAAITSSVFNW